MTTADIAALPVAEKLKLLEALRDSLCAQTGKTLASPPWHAAALKQAEDDLAAGTARFVAWAEAKDGLRRNSRIQKIRSRHIGLLPPKSRYRAVRANVAADHEKDVACNDMSGIH